jgi:hypothetical protein
MYSAIVARNTPVPVTALIKTSQHYDFFTYQGSKPVTVTYRDKDYEITKGTKFGVRKSANGKQIRLVIGNDVSRVFTISLDTARQLAKKVS